MSEYHIAVAPTENLSVTVGPPPPLFTQANVKDTRLGIDAKLYIETIRAEVVSKPIAESISVLSDTHYIPGVRLAEGPPGPPGPAGLSYTHLQTTPPYTWVINHNFGFTPLINLYSVGGHEMEGASLSGL